jgi:MoaA/NifB/PqqE/SkfB family radical SAM enzyme
MPGADAHPIGNLHQERFIEIWQSPAYNEFRRKFFEKRFEPFCDGCVYFDRNRDFNNKIKNKLTPSFFNQMESGL